MRRVNKNVPSCIEIYDQNDPDSNIKIERQKRKRPYPGFRKNIYDYISEYGDNTGIHGFKYMGEQKRTIFEKIWWFVFFCISLYICVMQIYETWIKWNTSPVLVSFAKTSTPVWQIPFPAVTVCPENKSRQTKYNFTAAYHKYRKTPENMTAEEMKKFSDSSLLCDNKLYNGGNLTTGIESIDFFMDIAPQFEEVLFSCKWTLLNETCANFFTPIATDDGICFTFNMLDRKELLRNNVDLVENYMSHGRRTEGWTLEGGYPKNAKVHTFPRRAMSAGQSAGFFLVLRAFKHDIDYACRGPVQGFKVLLHHPAEVPRVGMQYFRAPLNQEVVASIKPDMMTTADGLLGYDPHRRQCYFPHERYLHFYQSYTQQNCHVECLANYTLAKCGCVGYHMPHEKGTDICGSGSVTCMAEAQGELTRDELRASISKFENTEEESDSTSTCDCLPACTSLVYNAEISQAKYYWEKLFEAYRVNFNEMPGVQFTRVTIFFKEQQFITSERNELYGQTDFLANCGGLLGLFVGFSLLSGVEIVYFLSLRWICNVKKFGPHYWSASERLVNDDSYVHKKPKNQSDTNL